MEKKSMLDMIHARAEQRRSDKTQLKIVHSEALGGDITLKKPPISVLSRIMDENVGGDDFRNSITQNAMLVYEALPVLHDHASELISEFDVADPYDMVIAIWDNNLAELTDLAMEVMNFYGLGELKN